MIGFGQAELSHKPLTDFKECNIPWTKNKKVGDLCRLLSDTEQHSPYCGQKSALYDPKQVLKLATDVANLL